MVASSRLLSLNPGRKYNGYIALGWLLFLQEQIKVIIIIIHTERTVVFPFCTSNVMQSVRTSHLWLSSQISSPSSARVSVRSLIGSPRWDFTLIRKVALPLRTRCVHRQTISRETSASGPVASNFFPACPTNFLIAHKTLHDCTVVGHLHQGLLTVRH